MKWKGKFSGYFKNIFLTMTLASFSVLLLALLAFQLEFSRATIQYLSAVNHKFVKNAADSITYKFDTALNDVITAYSSHYGTALMASNEPTGVNLVSAMKEVDLKISQNRSVQSVYFFNGSTQMVSVFGGSRSHLSLDDFVKIIGDTEIIDIVRQQKPPDPFLRTLQTPYSMADSCEVITYIFMTPSFGVSKNAIVINLYPDEIFGILQSASTAYSEAQNNFLVFTKKNELVYNGVASPPLQEIGMEALTQAVFAHQGEALFRMQYGGETYLFNIYRAPDARTFVNIVSKNELAKSFSYSPIVFALLLFAACVLGIALVLLFSVRLYSPIGVLTSKLRQSGQNEGEKTKSEIEFITHSIEAATQKLDHLFEYKEKTLSLSQVSFLQDQLVRNRYAAGEFWQQSVRRELPYTAGDRFTLVLCSWCDADKTADSHILGYAVSNVFHELLDGALQVQSVNTGEREISFLCSYAAEDDAPASLVQTLESIRLTFLQYFDTSMSFVVSEPVADPELLCETRTALCETALYQYFYAEGFIARQAQHDVAARKTELCPLFDFDMFENALRAGEGAAAAAVLEAYFAQLADYSYEAALASVSLLAARLVACCKRVETQLLTKFGVDYHLFYLSVTQAQQLCAAQQAVQATVQMICAHINTGADSTMMALAGKVCEYIDENYRDFNLSSKAIAMQHHISVSTMNRIFKHKTGEAVAAYIKKLRLTKAIALLQKTSMPVEVIAREVGFENTKYFYTLFKTEFGISPSSYRITSSVTHVTQ